MTEAQSRALDAYVKADAEALVAAKTALIFVVNGEKPSVRMMDTFKSALNYYLNPQIAKIIDAK